MEEMPPKLLIFDMNGIFIDREFKPRKRNSPKESKDIPGYVKLDSYAIWKRPGIKEFLEYVFNAKAYKVAVWSSMSKRRLIPLCELVFGKHYSDLLFIFDQDDCSCICNVDLGVDLALPPRKDRIEPKPRFLKNLAKVWERYPQYNETNTIMIDDSNDKMINNPGRCHFNPGTWTREQLNDKGLLKGGILYEHLSNLLVLHEGLTVPNVPVEDLEILDVARLVSTINI